MSYSIVGAAAAGAAASTVVGVPSLYTPSTISLPPNSTNTKDLGGSGDEDSTSGKQLSLVSSSSSSSSSSTSYKWRMVIAYDGTRFAGWQFQQSPPTVQCTLEKALTKVTKLERSDLHFVGASRTDAGVHAWGQVAHFVTPFNYDRLDHVHAALNGLLPPDIRLREISPAVQEFHARFSTKSKIYHYKIYNDTFMDPFQRNYVYHSTYNLNVDAMREGAKHFVGNHDFSAFVNASRNDGSANPVKDIFRFDIIEMGPLLQLEVEGSGFLYRQVRNMVAILLQIGKEALPPEIIPMIIATRDRRQLAKYAIFVPPHGLCLMSVKYDVAHLRLPEECPEASFGRHHTIRKCKVPAF